MDEKNTGHPIRAALKNSRRVVVKIGSRSLVSEPGRFRVLADQLAELRSSCEGRSVVLVSSGAIAMGRRVLKMTQRPTDLALLQAASAIGQSALMNEYGQAFAPHNIPVAQVLLTHADLAERARFLNARRALEGIFSTAAIPIVNENDAVAVDEIRFGDNDQLAAMVCTLIGADVLVLLSDVEGVRGEGGKRISTVTHATDLSPYIEAPTDDFGSGGMGSKVDAARRGTRSGAVAFIADASDPLILKRLFGGEDVGTLFLPGAASLPSRKAWIAFTLRARGTLHIDAGAVSALRGGASLLSAGLRQVDGEFVAGDAVALEGPEGIIARGLVRQDSSEATKLVGAQGAVLVHRDDLVML
ncbi:MAG: glutamate 5-kinase [Polyangiales bacterium]